MISIVNVGYYHGGGLSLSDTKEALSLESFFVLVTVKAKLLDI